jgi:hypothetical protein
MPHFALDKLERMRYIVNAYNEYCSMILMVIAFINDVFT